MARRQTPAEQQAEAEEFVRIWQTSRTIAEVSERAGIGKHRASARASLYRARGVPLKNMRDRGQRRGREPFNWRALALIAESFAEGPP